MPTLPPPILHPPTPTAPKIPAQAGHLPPLRVLPGDCRETLKTIPIYLIRPDNHKNKPAPDGPLLSLLDPHQLHTQRHFYIQWP